MKRVLFILFVSLVGYPASGQTAYKTRNLIIVTIDGMRWQEVFQGADSSFLNQPELTGNPELYKMKFWNDDPGIRRKRLMPFLWETIGSQGQIYGNRLKNCYVNVANPYWFSYPGYSEIFCGFADSAINSNEFGPNPNINILEFLNRTAMFKDRIGIFSSWAVLNDILNEKRSNLPVNAGFDHSDDMTGEKTALLNEIQTQLPDVFEGIRLDGVTFQLGFEYLKSKNPRILYLAFDETDDFAHQGKYNLYLNSARYTDDFLKQLWEWIQKNPDYKDQTTLFITCDHGRGEDAASWKNHGSKTLHSDETWFAVIGPDTPSLGENVNGKYSNNQFAQTWAAFLGLKFENGQLQGLPIGQVLGR